MYLVYCYVSRVFLSFASCIVFSVVRFKSCVSLLAACVQIEIKSELVINADLTTGSMKHWKCHFFPMVYLSITSGVRLVGSINIILLKVASTELCLHWRQANICWRLVNQIFLNGPNSSVSSVFYRAKMFLSPSWHWYTSDTHTRTLTSTHTYLYIVFVTMHCIDPAKKRVRIYSLSIVDYVSSRFKKKRY